MRNFFYKELPSTNKQAKLLRIKYYGEELCIYTSNQFRGKGQAGNEWICEAGANITVSLVVYPEYLLAADQFILSKIISLAVCDLLELFLQQVVIKWPNDIYVGDNKIGGILIENDIIGESISSSIIGIGLNINQQEFDNSLPNPVSLTQITHVQYDLNEILSLFLNFFQSRYSDLLAGSSKGIHEDYIAKLYRYKVFAPFSSSGKWFEARIIDVGPFGHLILENKSGEKKSYNFKEIEFIIA
ncbi:MAG: biotin--[acetyl-CoA-carboxylase] ligase [Bacteroidales bacterium]|nr:biotin--[acetyl-CoA-carboxylase] ligase [Bacteroidales bacterium]